MYDEEEKRREQTRRRQREYARRRRAKDPEADNEYIRRWRATEAGKASMRKTRLKRMGLTPEEYDAILKSQDYLCACCGEPSDKWHIDHDHFCCPVNRACKKCIRGIVCPPCNHRIGYYEKSDLSQIERYLRGHDV